MNEQQIRQIIENYRLGQATPEELAFLESWYLSYYEQDAGDMPLTERLAATDDTWTRLAAQSQPPVKPLYRWRRMAAAAVLLLVVTTAAYLTWRSYRTGPLDAAHLAHSRYDIPPGANRATLTDASGAISVLDTTQAGIQVAEGRYTYRNGAQIQGIPAEARIPAGEKIRMLTLQTPKGGTYEVTLPDGSRVWLNAATSLVFPSSFHGAAERRVQLTGEAYFEVAANAQAPFRVSCKGQTVDVLGTHFNINSYPDEASSKTTLLEGSVRVGTTLLKPGQQAETGATGTIVKEVNTDAVMGWKNSYIVFEEEPIESVMRKIGRWYDVEIVYEGDRPSDDFGGRVNRYVYVSQVLKKLELTNKVHFKIEGRKIIVTK